ncbi:hemicentin-1-like [Macrobrachium rosenbergii]|uniref:hemicentin-1-like n=1 Tax=Macrobrachium rosenbergii TaxID=79674 RepID=UPI0034D51A82
MDLREYCHYGILPLLLVVSSSAFAEISSEVEVWGVAGGRVELPCEPKLKEPNDHPVLVLWYLSSNTTPVYSYDARTGDFSSGNRWADLHTFGNRAYFSALAVPPSLILEPLRSDDGGIYTCRIDYRRSPSTAAITNLTVIVPPGPPVVLWNGVGVVGSVGPLQENSQITLICRSNGGSPPPRLTWWWRGSKLSHQTTNVTFNPLSRSPKVESTVWLRATRGFQGALLTCHAHPPTPEQSSRNIILQPRTASVSLNITLPPLEISITGMRGPVSAGTALQLECRSVGSNPPAELTWWRGHLHLTEVVHSIYNAGNVTTATLTVVTNRDHDGATFACTASNPLLPNSPITRTVRLEVHYPPVATLRLGRAINSSIIQEGNDIYFECDVAANPEVQRIDWTHNGVVLRHNLKAGIMMSGLSLALQKLSKSNSGSYTCIAYNSEGRNTSNTLHLTVRHAPQCFGGTQAKIVGAARGTPTLLTCRVEAEPSEITGWEWVRIKDDNTNEKIPQKKVQSNGLTSSVRLTPLSQGDYGYVTCIATNEIGKQLDPCLINFVPAGPPDPPTNCSATPVNRGQETTSLSIACHEGFDGGLPQEFLLEVQQEKEVIANLSSEFPEWVVDQLLGGASVIIRVTSQNAHGKSEPLMLEVHTPLAQHREALDSSTKDKKTLLGATTLFGALVGVVVVLVILIIVSVIIARKAKPRPKNKPTIVSTTPVDNTWECYNPDLVSSAQQRQPNREALTVSQQSLPSPRLHTLMQKHRNTCLPLNEQAQNCIQMHRKSLPVLADQQSRFKGFKRYRTSDI